MAITQNNYRKGNRIELHEKLSLTGAEISLNELPAGANVPFVHSHKKMKKSMEFFQVTAKP